MNFYKLRYFEDEDQENPSIKGFREGYDTDAVSSATHIRRYQKIDFIPEIDFVLDEGGVATDILYTSSIDSNYLLVTQKLFEIFNGYRLLEHQHFDAVVRDKDIVQSYHFLNFYTRFDSDDSGWVDLEKTTFYSKETEFPLSMMAEPTDEDGVLGEFKVSSWSEYNELRGKTENDYTHKVISPLEKLYVKQKNILDLDLFYVDFLNFKSPYFVISERLADDMKSSDVSGAKIEPLSFEIILSP